MIEKIIESNEEEEKITISNETSCFVRDMDYFINVN
jgi:hypothetical protein